MAVIFQIMNEIRLTWVDKGGTIHVLIEPSELLVSQRKDASKNKCLDLLGMLYSIGQRESRSPGSTKNNPSIDTQVFSNSFQILYQIPRGVLF